MPIHGRADPLEKLPLLRQMCEQAGRDPDSIEIGIYGCPMRAEIVDRYREAGVDRVIFWLPADEPDAVLSAVEQGASWIT
jgi:alkanesulfonate monooxygenase SsuD/methylene tetrahydromethanopterin reductase-like flavin-dependent oxidoreductase (luciferase family)